MTSDSLRIYQVFGLTVQSDIYFPELMVCREQDTKIDLVIQKCGVDSLLPFSIDPKKSVQCFERSLLLSVPSVGRFLVEKGQSISYVPDTNLESPSLLRLYLLGSCMGIVLLQRGDLVLHGNAVVESDGQCRVYVGDSGAGKSTLAAWHVLNGQKLLTDDVAVIRFNSKGQPFVFPGYPQVKLWEESLNFLGIDKKNLRRIREGYDKYVWPIPESFCNRAYFLNQVVELTQDIHSVSAIEGANKINRLLHHTYRASFLNPLGLTGSYFKKLTLLAAQVGLSCKLRPDLSCAVNKKMMQD